MATETIARRPAVDGDLHTGAMVVAVDDDGANLFEVVTRRVVNGEHQVLLEDLSTPTPSERLESRLENAGRCVAEPERNWLPVSKVLGWQLVRPPLSLSRFTA